MRDLLRNYKMAAKRKDVSDSEAESQPLVSSHSTASSYETLRENIVFPESPDTTDYETEKPTQVTLTTAAPRPMYRRSFCFPRRYEPTILKTYNSYENLHYTFYPTTNGMLSDTPLIQHKSLLNISYKDITELECSATHGSVVTIFAIWNTIIGSSLLAMSWGLEKSGLFPGILLNVFVGGICLYTAYLLLDVNETHGLLDQLTEVPELCRMLLGRWAEILAKFFSLIVLFGANIVYWILMSNFLYNSVDFLYGYISAPAEQIILNNTVICPKEIINNLTKTETLEASSYLRFWDMHSTVPILLGFIMFPLLNFKSATFFTKFNSLGTLSVLYIIAFVCVKSAIWGINMPSWSNELDLRSSFCALTGMLSLSYFIHNIVISVMRHNRDQENNGRDLSIAFALVLFTYLITAVLFYTAFPLAKTCIEDNFLNNFEKHDVLAIIARLLFLFQLFTVFPLMTYMLRMDILTNINAIFKNCNYGDFTYCRVMLLNLFVVVICILFACFLPRIGTLIRYTGAFSGMVYIFALPSLLRISSLRKQGALTPLKLFFYVIIIIIGFVNLISQFFITD